MKNDRKEKLINLGAETLAEALLEVAGRSDAADDLIERMIATRKENVQKFKRKLSALKRSKRFIGWRESHGYARELVMLLQDLRAGVSDPLKGVELVAAFYASDSWIFEACDDSSGNVGDVFRYDAKVLFHEYASRSPDKEKVAELILELNREDNYGIRDTLVDCAGDFLPEPTIRSMITAFQERADNEKDKYGKRHHLMLIESLARQIRDPELFKKTRIESWGELSTAAFIDIATVYLESGNVEAAFSWVQKIPEDDTFKSYERDKLLRQIYERQGEEEKLTELLYRNFRSYHSMDTLQDLLNVIGENKREEVISDEIPLILEDSKLNYSDAEFFIEIGKMDEAEDYLLKRAGELNGHFYGSLLPLAERMAEENRNLAASLIYRCLLVSILERGYTKAYPHGIRYLKKLDKLAKSVPDWIEFIDDKTFKDQLLQLHGQKRSFWSKYKPRN